MLDWDKRAPRWTRTIRPVSGLRQRPGVLCFRDVSLSIQRSHASLQSARDYRGLCLLAREGLECTNVLFRPILPLHRFLCHLCSPLQPNMRTNQRRICK